MNWTADKRKIADLTPAEYNPRQMTEKQAEDLSNSLTKFSLADPIVINLDNKIIGGHQRINILKSKGVEEVDVRVPDRQLTEEEEKELNLRLNKNLGEWDFDMLANFDEELLKGVGFSSEELDKIFQIEPEPEDDDVPEVRETDIKLGDMFTLGEHRLLCGDATKKEDVEKLMAGDKADMVFTDPPYGINVVGKNGSIGKGVLAKEGTYRPVINDDKDFDPTFLLSYSDNLIIWGANFFSNMLPIGQWIVWDKQRPSGTTFGECELAWTSGKGKRIRKYECVWHGMTREGESGKRVHPTQKPIQLCVEIIKDFSSDNIILDLFGGSGSTLIACEKLNRKCSMMEIDPIYCQVIIDRWEQYSGKTASKI